MGMHQIKTTLAYLDGSVPHNYKFGFAQEIKTKNLAKLPPLLWKADGNAKIL